MTAPKSSTCRRLTLFLWLAVAACSDQQQPTDVAVSSASVVPVATNNAVYCGSNASRPAPVADAQKWTDFQQSIELPGGQLAVSVDSALSGWGATGVSIVVLEDFGVTQEDHWGHSDSGAGRLTSDQTFYHSASITKMVAGLVFAGAHRRGDVNIYTSATQYADQHPNSLLDEWRDHWFTGASANYPDKISIRRLLSHTAGLNHHGIGTNRLNNLQTFDDVLMGSWLCESLGICGAEEATRPIGAPRTFLDYSGGGFTVAELILELQTGSSFEHYAETNVLTPLLGASSITKFDTASASDTNLANPGTIYGSAIKTAGALLAKPSEFATIVEMVMNDGVDRSCATRIPYDDILLLLTPIHHENSTKTSCTIDADCTAANEECVIGKCKELLQLGGLDYGLGVKLAEARLADQLPRFFEHGGADTNMEIGSGFRGHRNLGTGIVVYVHGPNKSTANDFRDAIIDAYKCVYEGNSSACGGQANGTLCTANTDCNSRNCEPVGWWVGADKKCNATDCGVDGWDANDFDDATCSNDCVFHNQMDCPADETCWDGVCEQSCTSDNDCPADHPYCVYADAIKFAKLCNVSDCSPCQYDSTPDIGGCNGTFPDGDSGDCGAGESCMNAVCISECLVDADCPAAFPYCVWADGNKDSKVCGVTDCAACEFDSTPDSAGCDGTFANGKSGECGAGQQCYDATCKAPGTCSGNCTFDTCQYISLTDNCNPGFTAVGSCDVGCGHFTSGECECKW